MSAIELTNLEKKAFNALIDFASKSYVALDDWGAEQEDGVFISVEGSKPMVDAIDPLDELPDDQPGYIMSPIAKVQWALRRIFPPANM